MGTVNVANTSNNPSYTSMVGVSSAPIAAGATGPTIIKASPGTFYGILVTTVGVGAPQVFDNASAASGTIIGALAGSTVIGFNGVPAQGVKCVNGITVSGGATMPAMTIFYS